MTDRQIEPHRVTKPIQLLATWMVGLILTNTSFLGAATQFSQNGWESYALVIAAIVNVPLFLLALFILQTRFRAELQEDSFYSEYLSKKTSSSVRVDRNMILDSRVEELERTIGRITAVEAESNDQAHLDSARLDWSTWAVALNQLHPKFREVREALRNAAIPLSEAFGNENESPPSRWIVSLSKSLPVTHKAALLRAIIPYGFDGFQFWDPVRDAGETEDAYIGSYGGGSYARIDDSLSELLKTDTEEFDLRHYYSKHKVIYLDK